MAIDLTQLNTDLGHVIADMPLTITYSGLDYTAAEDPQPGMLEMESGGYVDSQLKRIIVQVSQFAAEGEATPTENAELTIESETWIIHEIEKHHDRNAETWTLRLKR